MAEFPDITLMTIPAFYRPNGVLNEEELLTPFMDGIVSGLDSSSKLVVGTEYSYGETGLAELTTIRDGTISQWLARSSDPQALQEKLSVAIGIQTDGINGGPFSDTDVTQNHRTPKEQEFAVYNALSLSGDYAWLYGETSRYTSTDPSLLMQQYFQANVNAKKVLPPFGNILFDEGFTAGAFDEVGSSLQSTNGGVGSEVAFFGEAIRFTNYANREGTYEATVNVDGSSSYVIQQSISVGAGAITENAMLLRAWDPATAVNVDLLLEAKENGSGWDIEITHAAGVSMAGLALARNAFHDISVYHLGDSQNIVELYVDGRYIGNYFGLGAGSDLGLVQIGNVSDSVGFSSATLDSLRIYEVLVLLGLAGDYDNSGAVGQGDLALVLQFWGATVTSGQSPDPAWINADSITGQLIGQDELALVLQNWGNTAAIAAQLDAITATTGLTDEQVLGLVPEPTTVVLMALGGMLMWTRRQRIR